MTKTLKILLVLLTLSVLALAILLLRENLSAPKVMITDQEITSFVECAAAGNLVQESYPARCLTETGQVFIQEIENLDSHLDEAAEEGVDEEGDSEEASGPGEELPTDRASACYVGGCSSHVCSDDPNVVTTCEYREEYACYATATCERQTDGQCGWTMDESLRQCLGETEGSFSF